MTKLFSLTQMSPSSVRSFLTHYLDEISNGLGALLENIALSIEFVLLGLEKYSQYSFNISKQISDKITHYL